METDNLLCEDAHAESVLPALVEALERVDPILCGDEVPIPGFPLVRKETKRHQGQWLVATPWGWADKLGSEQLGRTVYSTLWRFALYRVTQQEPDVVLPEVTVPAPGHVVLDRVTGNVAVYTDAQPETVLHNLHLRLDGLDTGDKLLIALRRKLARDKVPVYPVQVYETASLPYPWQAQGLNFQPATVANDQINVPLVGYALDVDTDEVVYLHIVGHKSGVRSVWATLGNNNRKAIYLDVPGVKEYLRGYSSHEYATYSTSVDPELGIYRLVIVSRRAIAQDVEERAYLVVPAEHDGVDLDVAFATRLNAVLPIAVLPEWGSLLREAGDEEGLVQRCASGGDVASAYAITPDPRWIEVIEGLVRSGDLTWEEAEPCD